MGEALYSKGVVRMSLMAAVDDSRKVCHIVVIIDVVIVIIVIIVASPPLTFINPQTVKVLSTAPPGTLPSRSSWKTTRRRWSWQLDNPS